MLIGLILGIVGIVIALAVPPIYQWRWFVRWRQKRELSRICGVVNRSIVDNSVTVGDLCIEDMKIGEILGKPELSLTSSDVSTEYSNQEKLLPDDLLALKHSYLKKEINRARACGRVLDNNLSYSLQSFEIKRIQNHGERTHRIRMVFHPTDFYTFVMTNLALDKKLVKDDEGRSISIREKYKLFASKLSLTSLGDLPIHFKFGCGAVVMTNDNYIVVSVRSDFQYIVENQSETIDNLHLSVAEGMLRPDDGEDIPNPFSTIIRALKDELNIYEGDYLQEDLRLIAVCLDTLRFQPIALFHLKLPYLSFTEVKERYQFAKDQHEHKNIIGIPFYPKDVCPYLLGLRRSKGKKRLFVSSHARIGILLNLLYEFPYNEVLKYLQEEVATSPNTV